MNTVPTEEAPSRGLTLEESQAAIRNEERDAINVLRKLHSAAEEPDKNVLLLELVTARDLLSRMLQRIDAHLNQEKLTLVATGPIETEQPFPPRDQ